VTPGVHGRTSVIAAGHGNHWTPRDGVLAPRHLTQYVDLIEEIGV
jgi:hypothetical protein